MVKIDFPVFNTLAQTKSKKNKVKNSFSQYSKYISYLGYVLMILYRFWASLLVRFNLFPIMKGWMHMKECEGF